MCGIAGIFGDAARDPATIQKMSAAIRHRGPDDDGLWIDPEAGVALASRRLSIIDVSPAGHQPMLSADGRFVLIFNGEIYNHAELRRQLEEAAEEPQGGWRGHCDTETFLQAISVWGLEAALEKAVGMFAFALWDRKKRKLSLVRDRFGEKPLYYGWAGTELVFASELKAIRCHPRFDAAVDRRALRPFTARGYIPAPLSIYQRVFKLEPASILEFDAKSARRPLTDPPEAKRYWSYREVVRAGLDDPIADEAEAIEELEQVLARAVHSQSLADVPVGAFLSGGIDSSTIVALYQKYSSVPVRTFTIGFEDQAYNEANDARAVARHLGTDHHERIVTAREAQEVIPRLPEIYDEPFADSSQIPTFLVSAFAREEVKVALSGDAGDELFGGYNRYFGTARLWSKMKRLPRPVRAAAAASLGSLPTGAWNGLGRMIGGRSLPSHFGAKVQKSFQTVGSAQSLDELFSSFVDEWAGAGSPVLGDGEGDDRCGFDLDVSEGAADALRMMYCDAVSYLPDDILCKVDRASMAVGLEAHVPFLDHRVAALAARIPIAMKIRGGTGKAILRKLLYREAPRRLFERPKAGFGLPVGDWLRGPLRGWAEELLDAKTIRSEGWFDADLVVSRWQQHRTGARDSTAALWSILMFQAWLKDQNSLAVAAA
jgi:asparagine synthase (glutamine-hydrolysing)